MFKERLLQAMKLRNTNQSTLSKLTGIGKSSLSQYLSGVYNPKQDKIYLLSKALSVDPSWLMGADVKNYDLLPIIPQNFFTDETKAARFLLEQNVIMEFNGLDVTKLNEEEQIEYANEILNQIKLISYKYKYKKWHRWMRYHFYRRYGA